MRFTINKCPTCGQEPSATDDLVPADAGLMRDETDEEEKTFDHDRSIGAAITCAQRARLQVKGEV